MQRKKTERSKQRRQGRRMKGLSRPRLGNGKGNSSNESLSSISDMEVESRPSPDHTSASSRLTSERTSSPTLTADSSATNESYNFRKQRRRVYRKKGHRVQDSNCSDSNRSKSFADLHSLPNGQLYGEEQEKSLSYGRSRIASTSAAVLSPPSTPGSILLPNKVLVTCTHSRDSAPS